jgi:hypothetical protein
LFESLRRVLPGTVISITSNNTVQSSHKSVNAYEDDHFRRLISSHGDRPDDVSVGAVVHHSRAVENLAQELFLKYGEAVDDAFTHLQGATDGQVARRLGVSMRTVRRMIARLSG